MEIHLTPELAYDGEIKVEQPDGFLKTVPQYHSIVEGSEIDRLTSQISDLQVGDGAYYRVLKPESIQFSGFFQAMIEDLSSGSSSEDEEKKKINTCIVTGADRGLLDLVLDFFEHYASLPNPEKWRNEPIEERRKEKCFLPEDEISDWDTVRLSEFHTWRLLKLSKVAEYFDTNLIRMKVVKWMAHHEFAGFDDVKLKASFGINRVFTEEEREYARNVTGIPWL